MHALRRLFLLVAVSAFCLGLLLVGEAQAAHGDHYDCLITGIASAKVAPVGGTGSYSFTELTPACLGQSKAGGDGGANVGETAVLTLDISSNGTFSNQICGTGTADSSTAGVTAHVLASIPLGDPDRLKPHLQNANLNYHIDFTAGVGSLNWIASTTTGGGVVDITADPLQPGGTDGNCTDGFKVAGEVQIDI